MVKEVKMLLSYGMGGRKDVEINQGPDPRRVCEGCLITTCFVAQLFYCYDTVSRYPRVVALTSVSAIRVVELSDELLSAHRAVMRDAILFYCF